MALFSFLPAFIYILIVFLSTPYGSIDLNKISKFIFGGFLSTLLVLALSVIFPNMTAPLFLVNYTGLMDEPSLTTYFYSAFIQIATVEELCKYFLFFIMINFFSKNDKKNTFSLLFNCMLVGTGFAMLENFVYSIRYERVMADTLLVRTFSSVLVHMACGIIMGYFIALGNKNTHYSKDISEFNIWMKRNTKYKKIIYTIFGISFAIIAHGLYDFNIFINLGYSIHLTIIMLVVAFFLFKDLKKKEFIAK
jgi:RsiW-degrading membrane proteinase PrsW (M82 family)